MPAIVTENDKQYYRVLIALGAVLLSVILVYVNTYADMAAIWWRSGTFAHGFVVLPIALYLIWCKRDDLAQTAIKPDVIAFLVLFILICIWLVASTANVAVGQQLAVILMIPAAVWTLFGRQFVLTILFPLLYLMFMVPFGEFLVPWLQDVTAEFSVWLLRLTDIPVLMEGRFLYLPSGSFEVAEACSGIRYLIATLALGTLYAYITYSSYTRRWLFVLLSLIIPIAANAVRAYGIIMLAHLSDYKLAVGIDHIVYGWLFFGLVILFMFWVGNLFREKSLNKNPYQNVRLTDDERTGFDKLFGVYSGLLALVLVTGPVSAGLLNRPITVAQPNFNTLLSVDDQWRFREYKDPQWQPEFTGAMVEKNFIASNGSNNVHLYLAYYGIQKQGQELINSSNVLYDRNHWKRISNRTFLANHHDKWTLPVNETVIASDVGGKVIWSWYEVGGKVAANPVIAKLYEVQSRFQRSKVGSTAIVLAANFLVDQSEAKNILQAFVDENLNKIEAVLGTESNY